MCDREGKDFVMVSSMLSLTKALKEVQLLKAQLAVLVQAKLGFDATILF
jgi:hypothetical protein